MSVKFVVAAYTSQLDAMVEWLDETEGQVWISRRHFISGLNFATGECIEQCRVTFRRDADALSFYLRWYGVTDVYVSKRYEPPGLRKDP